MILFYSFISYFICSYGILLRDPASFVSKESPRFAGNLREEYKWTEEWLDNVPIDHFAFVDNRTFSLRYLINTEYFASDGPIFFYTGNEGNIEGFAMNTGFIWDLAPKLGAAIVFAEHRFYGKTKPFGNESYADVNNLGYLSSEQALADFAMLIRYLRKERLYNATTSPVIAFGGSYGGMLAAWIRIKYPHLVEGAIAASAPVFWFPEMAVPEDIYDHIVTRSFVNSGCIAENVASAWESLENLAATDTGREYLNEQFHLEEKSSITKAEDVAFLKSFIRESFESMAMVNYPYPSNFLSPLPGWPVKVACQFFNSTGKKSDKENAKNLYSMVNLYYNYTGTKEKLCANPEVCGDSAYAALGDPLGWPWQACTEMVMQLCGSGLPNDFFWKDCPFTVEGVFSGCNKTFGKIGYTRTLLRPNWQILNYGDRYPTASNIVFSNGYLDPWSGGGWSLKPETVGSIVSIIIEDGAHHYDLRGHHPDDTDAVKDARRLERIYIEKWLRDAQKRKERVSRRSREHTLSFNEISASRKPTAKVHSRTR